jgi:hypothetical protein
MLIAAGIDVISSGRSMANNRSRRITFLKQQGRNVSVTVRTPKSHFPGVAPHRLSKQIFRHFRTKAVAIVQTMKSRHVSQHRDDSVPEFANEPTFYHLNRLTPRRLLHFLNAHAYLHTF